MRVEVRPPVRTPLSTRPPGPSARMDKFHYRPFVFSTLLVRQRILLCGVNCNRGQGKDSSLPSYRVPRVRNSLPKVRRQTRLLQQVPIYIQDCKLSECRVNCVRTPCVHRIHTCGLLNPPVCTFQMQERSATESSQPTGGSSKAAAGDE